VEYNTPRCLSRYGYMQVMNAQSILSSCHV